MTNTKLLAGAIALAAAIPLLAAPTASAHPSCLENVRGRGCVSTDHRTASVCDTNSDGFGVRVYYVTSNNVRDHVGDANGHEAPCGSELATGGGTITLFRFCYGEHGTDRGCTAWKRP